MSPDDPAFHDTAALIQRCTNEAIELSTKHRDEVLAFIMLEGVFAALVWAYSKGWEHDVDIINDTADNVIAMVGRLRAEEWQAPS